MDNKNLIIVAFVILFLIGIYFLLTIPPKREGYRDPIYLNYKKLYLDDYPRANGTIYGPYSNMFTGYPFYFKAY